MRTFEQFCTLEMVKFDIELVQMSDAEVSQLAGVHICPIDKTDPRDKAKLIDEMEAKGTWQERKIALSALGRAQMLQIREDSMPQVEALMGAGWLFEAVTESSEPWQWAWRRPARRKGSKGMRFASTSQAFKALTRSSK